MRNPRGMPPTEMSNRWQHNSNKQWMPSQPAGTQVQTNRSRHRPGLRCLATQNFLAAQPAWWGPTHPVLRHSRIQTVLMTVMPSIRHRAESALLPRGLFWPDAASIEARQSISFAHLRVALDRLPMPFGRCPASFARLPAPCVRLPATELGQRMIEIGPSPNEARVAISFLFLPATFFR
jgi:hypothetical protein